MTPIVDYIRADLVKPVTQAAGDEDMNSIDRELGGIAEQMKSMASAVASLESRTADLTKEVLELRLLIAQLRGGSKVLLWVGGLVSGGTGAAIMKLLGVYYSK